jgi:hypothetical protein
VSSSTAGHSVCFQNLSPKSPLNVRYALDTRCCLSQITKAFENQILQSLSSDFSCSEFEDKIPLGLKPPRRESSNLLHAHPQKHVSAIFRIFGGAGVRVWSDVRLVFCSFHDALPPPVLTPILNFLNGLSWQVLPGLGLAAQNCFA